jgi:hypothetical protein
MKIFRRSILGLIALALIMGAVAERPASGSAGAAPSAESARFDRSFGRVPLFFVPNRGQLDPSVDFFAPGGHESVFFGADGVTIVLTRDEPDGPAERGPAESAATVPVKIRWALKLNFVGASPGVIPAGEDETGAVISYFSGRPEGWIQGLPAFSRIVYRDLWPGIDLAYSGSADLLKYEFLVRPGADASRIRMAVRGASRLEVTSDGQLEVGTPLGAYRDRAPVAYQERRGHRVPVPAAFRLEEPASAPGSANAADTYGFAVGEYDRTSPLVIDPATVIACGFLGGSADDAAAAVAIDSSGCAYVAGTTASFDFPANGGLDTTFNSPAGGTDAFVAKVNAAGTGLVFCCFLGGAANDVATGIAVDPAGNAYATGWTFSQDFPVFYGPVLTPQPNISEVCDAFVTKILFTGTALVFSGFVGGSMTDKALAIAVSDMGDAVITGSTESDDLPQRFNRRQYRGGEDAFVSGIWRDGYGVSYSVCIGGLSSDFGTAIAVDHHANVYITGRTTSTPADGFPVIGGPGLSYSGNQDAFVANIQRGGYEILYCGYIGGAGIDSGSGIAIDKSGSAYVTGTTDSGAGFPTKAGPYLSPAGGDDAFVAKLSPPGSEIVYSGFIGGAGNDRGAAIAVDAAGNAYVTGTTDSTTGFPVAGGPGLIPSGLTDAFVATVRYTGADLMYCGYLGGSQDDAAAGVAADGMGNVFVAGTTRSADFPVAVGPILTPGDLTGATTDAFVARIFEELPPTAPEDLRFGAVTASDIEIVWTDASGRADGFKIERKDGEEGMWVEAGETGSGETTFQESGFAEGSLHYYRVRAWNDIGDSVSSAELLVWTRPAAPSDLTATVINEREVDLSWVDHSNTESSFALERKINPQDPWLDWQGFAMTDANVTTFRDVYVVEDTTYIYRVRATNLQGYSAPANEATATTPPLSLPAPPTNLQAIAPDASRVRLTWEDNAYNESGYKIEQMTGAAGTWDEITQHAYPSWMVEGLVEKTTYAFRVRATNRAGDSAFSNEAMVTTPAYQPVLRLPLWGVSFGYRDECSGWMRTTDLYNDGQAPLVVNSVAFVSGSREFSYLGPATPFSIAPQGSQEIAVGFAPVGAEGQKTAMFAVATNDPANPVANLEATGYGSIPLITFKFDVQRLTARIWMLQREYVRVDLSLSCSSPGGQINYRLLRKVGTGPYQTIQVFPWAGTSGGNWTYLDTFIERALSYTYKIEAWDCRGVVIHQSQEVLLAAPGQVKESRLRQARRGAKR